jgi:hypothetical protein
MLKTPRPGLIIYRYGGETRAWPVGSARLHSRTMNKVGVVRPACRAVVQGSAGIPTGQTVKRLQMHLASPTGQARLDPMTGRGYPPTRRSSGGFP